jgi:hypothetical protein
MVVLDRPSRRGPGATTRRRRVWIEVFSSAEIT